MNSLGPLHKSYQLNWEIFFETNGIEKHVILSNFVKTYLWFKNKLTAFQLS